MNDRWREVVEAGHRGGDEAIDLVRAALADADGEVRELALGALDRLGQLSDDALVATLADPSAPVRRRAVELAAKRPAIDLLSTLHDPDPIVLEHAAWACGEHEVVSDAVLDRLIELAGASEVPLVREAAVAALGAIGDERGLPAIIAGCSDQPTVRRRAVLALAPFEGDEVEATVDRALIDRDWQVRQAAEDLRRAARDP
jgi:HEAT repeat protein